MLKVIIEVAKFILIRWITLNYKETFVNRVFRSDSAINPNKPKRKNNDPTNKKLFCIAKFFPGKSSKNSSPTADGSKKKGKIKKKIYLTLLDKLCDTFFRGRCRNKKIGDINSFMKIIEKKLDLIYIFKRFSEFEKLKELVLDENQIKLFKNISYAPNKSLGLFQETPKISIYENEKGKISFNANISEETKEAFRLILNKEKKTRIDVQLLRMIGYYPNIECDVFTSEKPISEPKSTELKKKFVESL